MATAIIENVSPDLNGEYEFDIDRFTTADWRLIKVHTGLVMGQIPDAFEQGDLDAPFGLALVALQRNGVRVTKTVVEILSNAELGSVRIDLRDEEEAEPERPPESPPESGDEPSSGKSESETAPVVSSETSSNGTSDHLENPPSPTGTHGLVTGSPV